MPNLDSEKALIPNEGLSYGLGLKLFPRLSFASAP